MILKWIEKLRLPKIPDGLIDDSLSWDEFLYEAISSIDVNTLKDISNTSTFKFNQWKYILTKSACTIVNSWRWLLKVVEAYYWYKPTNQDIFDMVDYAVTMWYTVGSWWFGYKWVDACRKYWNAKHPDMQVSSYLINYTDPDFQKLLDKWYALSWSYNGSTLYTKDYRDNAILEWKSFWPRTYGHWTNREKGIVCNDSYTGNFYNIYKILYPKEIIDNRVRGGNFYFFAPMNDNSAEIKRLQGIIADCTSQNEIAYRLIKSVNDTDFQKLQSELISRNLSKINDAKEWLKDL